MSCENLPRVRVLFFENARHKRGESVGGEKRERREKIRGEVWGGIRGDRGPLVSRRGIFALQRKVSDLYLPWTVWGQKLESASLCAAPAGEKSKERRSLSPSSRALWELGRSQAVW